MNNVLIIGAGMAGLAAANKLASNGMTATVLEARDRIGGRVWTDYSLDIPISLGAQWLHGIEGNPIADLARELSLHYAENDIKKILFFDRNRQPVAKNVFFDFFAEFDDLLQTAKEYANQQTADMPLLTALDSTAKPNSRPSLWQDLYRFSTAFLCLYNGVDAKYLSARHWDLEETLTGGNFLLADGFSPVVNHLAKKCNIHCNTVVTKINYHKKEIVASTNQGEFSANKIIITVPLGVLKQEAIQFDPVLPIAKKTAIAKLQMGILNSIVLKFPKIFWPKNEFGMFFTDREFQAIINLYRFQQAPILTIRTAGDKAKHFETYSDEKLIDQVMAELRQTFGADIPHPEKYLTTRWGHDPFAYGSYSCIPVHATGAELDSLAAPIDNRLFFAGETTHRQHPATIHGAYLSGLRAAQEVMEQ